MVSWVTIGFDIGFRSVKRAYRESSKGFQSQILDLDERFAEYRAAVRAGQVEDEDGDADYRDYLGESLFEAEQGIRLVREAFALVLYHFWEREACSLLHIPRYDQPEVFKSARASSLFELDEGGLDRLRMIVNCIKHDNGFKLHASDPGMFDPQHVPASEKSPGWQSALRLRDEDLERAFDTVEACGPRAARSEEPTDDFGE